MVLEAWGALVHKKPPSYDKIVKVGKDLWGHQVQLETE